MGIFRKNQESETAREADFQTVLNIVKNFDKTEFKRFMGGIELAWEGYDKILRVKTRDEKEVEPVTKIEQEMEVDG